MTAGASPGGGPSPLRRQFLQGVLWTMIPSWVLAAVVAPPARGAAAPGRRVPSVVDVRDHGAVGDGIHDDTGAFQATIDAMPASGGTVRVPAGRYLIDAARSVRLRSHVHLLMDADARLIAIPNALERSYVILVEDVDDVTIRGGRIVGERAGHRGSSGEWGHGISVHGARRVTVADVEVSACWGDGICIGTIFGRGGLMKVATDVTIERVVCRGNRRQGLSITSSRRVKVLDSQFTDTGGTRPGCGIDVEPGTRRMGAVDVLIARCTVSGNQGSGVQLDGINVSRLRLEHCEIRDNHGYGVLMSGVNHAVIADNTIADNGLTGALVRENVSECRIAGNTFRNNSTRRLHQALKQVRRRLAGVSPAHGTGDLKVRDGARAIVLGGNRFDP